ncbi:transporter [Aeromonas hydrophila]|nr:transporter [Aeromonas hydrophila]
MNNKLSLTAISFLANFVMAGFATQFGMLIDPIAAKFGADVNQVASIFSLLNGGALAGTIAAFFLIEKVGLKRMTLICYGLIALAAAALHLTGSLYVVMAAMTVIGLAGLGWTRMGRTRLERIRREHSPRHPTQIIRPGSVRRHWSARGWRGPCAAGPGRWACRGTRPCRRPGSAPARALWRGR